MLVTLQTSQLLPPAAGSCRAPPVRPQVPSPISSAILLSQLALGQDQLLELLSGAPGLLGCQARRGHTSFETNVKYFKPNA